jgi:hypothetical protein
VYESSSFTYRDSSGKSRRIKTDGAREGSYFAGKLLDNFVGVLEGREQPIVAAGDVRPAISVIDGCYQRRSTMAGALVRRGRDPGPCLASGQCSSRVPVASSEAAVVEVLHQLGADRVRAGLRRWGSGARVGRLPVELVQVDIRDDDQLRRALAGVTHVVNFAVGEPSTTVDGTRKLLTAAHASGVQRVVHISTVERLRSTRGRGG